MTKKLGIGIVGAGVISHFHMKGYEKTGRIEPVAVYDIDKGRAEAYAKQYGVGRVCDTLEEMLAMGAVEAVSVCSSNGTHAPVSMAALEAGKHVLCEKPPAFSLQEMLDVEKVVRKSDKVYMVGFVRRFYPKSVILKSFIDSGKLGEIFYGEAAFRRRAGNPGGWFANKSISGGGPLIDIGIHIIDLAIYMMGKPKAVSVSAATSSRIGVRNNIRMYDRYRPAVYDDYCDVEDSAYGFVRFENGAVLHVKCSFCEHIKENYMNIELQGSKGGATFEPKLEIYSEENDYLVDIAPMFTEVKGDPLQYMMDQEMDYFVKCVNGEVENISPVEDGVQIMKILNAIYASAETGKEVVL